MDLFLFTVHPAWGRDVVAAGAAGIVVDWERRGKARRQQGEGEDRGGEARPSRPKTMVIVHVDYDAIVRYADVVVDTRNAIRRPAANVFR